MVGYLRTTLLLAAMTALFAGIGFLLGGQQGMVIAFVVAAGINVFSWWNSDRMVLRMHNAQPVGPQEAPRLYEIVAHLATNAGLPMPALYVIHEEQPNAFATGRNPSHAAVAVNSGLLDIMDEEEAAAVIAHELAHIRNRDTLIMTVSATLAGAITMLAQFGGMFAQRNHNGQRQNPLVSIAMLVLAPIAAAIVQMAVSRSREYEADRVGAQICGNPLWLARALRKLEQGAHAIPNYGAERNPATAHMFIINPLSGAGMDNLFSTHPKTANRVAALEQQAGQMGLLAPAYQQPQASPWGDTPQRGPWG